MVESAVTQRALELVERKARGQRIALAYEPQEVQDEYNRLIQIPQYRRAIGGSYDPTTGKKTEGGVDIALARREAIAAGVTPAEFEAGIRPAGEQPRQMTIVQELIPAQELAPPRPTYTMAPREPTIRERVVSGFNEFRKSKGESSASSRKSATTVFEFGDDVLTGLTLRRASTGGAAPTMATGEEVEARTRRVRAPFGSLFSVPNIAAGPASIGIPYNRAAWESFKIARTERREARDAEATRVRGEEKFGIFQREVLPSFTAVNIAQTNLNKEIESLNLAGGASEEQIAYFSGASAQIERDTFAAIRAAESKGIEVTGQSLAAGGVDIQFGAPEWRADIRPADVKQFEFLKASGKRTSTRVAGAVASDVAKGGILGGAFIVAGGEAALGSAVSKIPAVVRGSGAFKLSVGTLGGAAVVGSTARTGLIGFQEGSTSGVGKEIAILRTSGAVGELFGFGAASYGVSAARTARTLRQLESGEFTISASRARKTGTIAREGVIGVDGEDVFNIKQTEVGRFNLGKGLSVEFDSRILKMQETNKRGAGVFAGTARVKRGDTVIKEISGKGVVEREGDLTFINFASARSEYSAATISQERVITSRSLYGEFEPAPIKLISEGGGVTVTKEFKASDFLLSFIRTSERTGTPKRATIPVKDLPVEQPQTLRNLFKAFRGTDVLRPRASVPGEDIVIGIGRTRQVGTVLRDNEQIISFDTRSVTTTRTPQRLEKVYKTALKQTGIFVTERRGSLLPPSPVYKQLYKDTRPSRVLGITSTAGALGGPISAAVGPELSSLGKSAAGIGSFSFGTRGVFDTSSRDVQSFNLGASIISSERVRARTRLIETPGTPQATATETRTRQGQPLIQAPRLSVVPIPETVKEVARPTPSTPFIPSGTFVPVGGWFDFSGSPKPPRSRSRRGRTTRTRSPFRLPSLAATGLNIRSRRRGLVESSALTLRPILIGGGKRGRKKTRVRKKKKK